MRLPPYACRSRRGIASLEFVMVFPILLILVSVLFIVGRADVAKLQTVTGTRNQTWAARPGPSGSPINWPHDPMQAPLVLPPNQQPYSLAPVIARQTQQAQSQVTFVANPWAFQSVPFPPASDHAIPHTSVLKLLPSPAGESLADVCQAMAISYPDGSSISHALSYANDALIVFGGVIAFGPAVYPGIYLLGAAQGHAGD